MDSHFQNYTAGSMDSHGQHSRAHHCARFFRSSLACNSGDGFSFLPSMSDVEDVDEPPFKLEQVWAVTPKHGDTWYPQVRMQEGINFIRMSKFDRYFVKFCTGKPMDLRKGVGHTANSVLFDDLLKKRKRASEESVQKHLEMPDHDADSQQERPKKKRLKVREEDKVLVSGMVRIQLPALETDSMIHLSRSTNVLWGVSSKDLWIELSYENLSYMQSLVVSGLDQKPARKPRSSPKKKTSSPKKLRRQKAREILDDESQPDRNPEDGQHPGIET